MTAQLSHLPGMKARCARITANAHAERDADDRAEWVRKARATLRHPEHMPAQILRDACAVLQAWGDGTDWLEADAMLFALNKRERMRAHDAARETSARIALRHLPRWPALLAGAVAFTGFWWGVVAVVMGVGG